MFKIVVSKISILHLHQKVIKNKKAIFKRTLANLGDIYMDSIAA